jgi:hypothetical protein
MHPNQWKVPARKLPQVYQNQANISWMRRRLFQCLDMKAATKSLNKFISNSFALKIKRESLLVPGKEAGFQKSCVQYSGVYQESSPF